MSVILLVSIISFLFMVSGFKIYNYSSLCSNNHSFVFKSVLSYFLGIGLILSVWRISASILGSASISLIFSFLFLLLLCISQKIKRKDIEYIVFEIKKKKYLLFIFFFIVIFKLLTLLNDFDDIHSHFGSVESGRYANIAYYITNSDKIPIIGQNYGQSMLASILLFTGVDAPYLALNMWLSISLFFFCILIYEFLKSVNVNIMIARVGVFIVMFGSTALSFTRIMVLDIGNPLILSGYTDTIFSMGTVLLFLIWYGSFTKTDISYNLLMKNMSIFFILGTSWSFTSPQNILLIITFLLFMFVYTNKRRMVFLSITIFMIFFIIGISQGGLFSPLYIRDVTEIPGLIESGISSNDSPVIVPAFPFHFGMINVWKYGNDRYEKPVYDNLMNFSIQINNMIFRVESNLWTSIRIFFFPIFGILAMLYLVKYKQYSIKSIDIKILLLFSLMSFIIGFLMVFFINISKWPLSRFLIPSYLMGMIFLVMVIDFYYPKISKHGGLLLSFIVFLLTIGSVIDSLYIIFINILNLDGGMSFLEKIDILSKMTGIIK